MGLFSGWFDRPRQVDHRTKIRAGVDARHHEIRRERDAFLVDCPNHRVSGGSGDRLHGIAAFGCQIRCAECATGDGSAFPALLGSRSDHSDFNIRLSPEGFGDRIDSLGVVAVVIGDDDLQDLGCGCGGRRF